MNRRNFFTKTLSLFIGLAALPQKIVANPLPLKGYTGSNFYESGIVYAPIFLFIQHPR